MSDYTENQVNPFEWPLAKFNFRVSIDGLDEMGFQTVEGLESEISIMEYRPGNSQFLFKSKRPGLVTYSNITFKKGEFLGDPHLKDFWMIYAWDIQENRNTRKEILIELLDEAESVTHTWTVRGCFLVKFTPTSMDAEADSEVAVEEIEVACESWMLEKV
ncbi:phage tail protein [Aureispira]|jgi:phage tail-like protein|nr:phage tail protein [Aureispira sp.]